MSSVVKNTLPDEWGEIHLGEVAQIKGGKRLPRGEKLVENKTPYPYIRVADFNDYGGVNDSGIKYITTEVYEQIKRYTISSSDVYISIAGTIGKTGVISNDLNGANLTENAAKVVINNLGELSTRFLYYFTLTGGFEAQIKEKTKIVAQPKLALTRLREVLIPIPPHSEQKRIVGKIDTLFAKIDKAISLTEESLVQAKNLLPSVLEEVFEKGKADGWEEKKLGEVLKIDRGGSPRPIKDYLTEDENGLNWIKISDATKSISDKYIYETKQRIKPEGLHKTRFVKEGDFILSNSMSFGKPYIMKTEGCIHDGWLSLKILDSSCLETDFLYFVLLSPSIYGTFKFLSAGTTVKNLNKEIVASVPISFPRLDEQKEIVSMLDKVSQQSNKTQSKLEEQLAYLKQLKSSVLSKAFKGEL
jgi:type I restriction enzyme, S subunit